MLKCTSFLVSCYGSPFHQLTEGVTQLISLQKTFRSTIVMLVSPLRYWIRKGLPPSTGICPASSKYEVRFIRKEVSAGGGDKCHQLRHLIEKFNAHSKASFLVERESTFDEGGVGCHSRMCPCRQYNGSKPQKFCVDFFIWACAKTYAVLHLDVYQGKNGNGTLGSIRPHMNCRPPKRLL